MDIPSLLAGLAGGVLITGYIAYQFFIKSYKELFENSGTQLSEALERINELEREKARRK